MQGKKQGLERTLSKLKLMRELSSVKVELIEEREERVAGDLQIKTNLSAEFSCSERVAYLNSSTLR